MPNKAKNFLNNLKDPNKRNDKDIGALLRLGDNIKKSADLNSSAPRLGFQEELKAKIAKKRSKKTHMPNPLNFIKSMFRPKIMVPAAISALIVLIVLSSMYMWPFFNTGKFVKEGNLFEGFSKLMISPAHAADNFTLEPASSDSLGVDSNSTYILKSKEPVDTGLIKDHLVLEPQIDFKVKEISNTEWEIIPETDLEPNALLRVALATSYIDEGGQQQERDYSWAYQVKDTFQVLHSLPRDEGSDVPTNTGIEITFSHDNFTDYEKYFSIEPKVAGKFEHHGRTLVFVPNDRLEENKIYKVKLSKELPLTNSQETLGEDYVFSFETEGQRNYGEPEIYIYNRDYQVSSQDKPMVQLSAYNMADVGIDVKIFKYKSYDQYLDMLRQWEALPYWSSSWRDFKASTNGLTQVNQFQTNIQEEDNVSYIAFPDTLPKGIYLAELSYQDETSQVFIQVSDLVTFVNSSRTDTIVWVNNAVSKQPEDGVSVSFVESGKNYKTNSEGVANFPTPENIFSDLDEKEMEKKDVHLRIEKRGDVLITRTNRNLVNYDKSEKNPSDYWTYVYTDRPLYQSNDVIKYWGMVKDRDGRNDEKEVSVSLYRSGYIDYYYRPVMISEQTVELSNSGTFSGEVNIKNLQPNTYNLEIKIGNLVVATKYITVHPYTKPAYDLTLEADKTKAFADDTIHFKVKAGFFEGTPVPNLELVAKTPNGEKTLTTDEKGEAEFSYSQPYEKCLGEFGCWPDIHEISVRAKNAELGEITAEQYVTFYGPNVYLQNETEYPSAGRARLTITSKYIDLKALEALSWWQRSKGDELAPGTKIDGEVTKITYTQVEEGTHYDFINKRTYKSYRYDRKEEVVDKFSGTTNSDGVYVYERGVDKETSYKIKIVVTDKNGKQDNYYDYFYYWDGVNSYQYGYGSSYKYYNLEKEGNKQYKINDQVTVRFKENNEVMSNKKSGFLFLQMQNGLQEYQVSDSAVYQFPFESRDIPNINLLGVYFTGITYTIAQTSYYNSAIAFDTSEKALKIHIDSDKDKYEPGEEVELKVRVTDKDDRPAQAEVNLNLVDEAFYAISEDTANPISSIYSHIYSGELYQYRTHVPVIQAFGGAEMGCFTAGTMISMNDGSEKPIEKIMVGDKIKTFVSPVSKEMDEAEVTQVFTHVVPGYLVINDRLHVTPEHRIYTNYHFDVAGNLQVGDWLLDKDGKTVFVEKIEKVEEITKVYNFTTEPYHTYIADGIYVHNEKGGGPREFFTDAALFQVVKTNGSGRAEVKFTLPDNITSWRVTAQAISDDLYVGANTAKLPVSLPVFAEVNVGKEYLAGEDVSVKMRAFGSSLNANDDANFKISAPSLGVEKSDKITAKAFSAAYFDLPKLTLGNHDIVYELDTAKGKDAIKLPMEVKQSRLEARSAKNEILTPDTVITAENDSPITVVLSDLGQNKLYNPLYNLSWTWGDRVDQKLSKQYARELLNKYYEEEIYEQKINGVEYQMNSGAITLLPYSDGELELTARVAAVSKDDFDEEAMKQYLFQTLENKKTNREQISIALYGLAELGEPVLPRLQVWLDAREDLTPIEKLYLAQALADVGAKEDARKIYLNILEKYGEINEPYIILHISEDADEVFKATALASVLASTLHMPERDGLWQYLNDEQRIWGPKKNSETLYNLEKLRYIAETLPQLKPSPAEVTYTLFGKEKHAKVTGGATHSITLDPSQVNELDFTAVEGKVGVATISTKPLNTAEVERDPNIAIRREYYVNGVKTNTFNENDTVEVRIYPAMNGEAYQDPYQVTDILPSGLTPVTRINTWWQDNNYRCTIYPYNSDGHFVKFKVYQSFYFNRCGSFHYYARVITPGTYKAEPAVIQSFLFPEHINYSDAGEVVINKSN